MNNGFWSGLFSILTLLFYFIVIVAIVLFVIVFIYVILQKIDTNWARKYSKKLKSIFSQADAIKNIVKSTENIINDLIDSFAGIVDLMSTFIVLVFGLFDKLFLLPIRIFNNYMKLFSKKLEKFNQGLEKKIKMDNITAVDEKPKDNDYEDENLEEYLSKKRGTKNE